MIDISKRIEIVQALLSQGDAQALTYAALECRLTIELICYERLVISYDKLSHDELRRWQPKDVVEQVVEDANELADKGFTISISKTPISDTSKPTTQSEFENLAYVKIGEQAAVDLKKVGRLWHSLSNVALHVSIPSSKDDPLSIYGDVKKIKKKVEQTLEELEKLKAGNLLSGSFGANCCFTCASCGIEIKRTQKLLSHGRIIYCPNPQCDESYLVHQEGADFFFNIRVVQPVCQSCKRQFDVPLKVIEQLRFGKTCEVACGTCGAKNFMELRPVQVKVRDKGVT